MHGMHQRKKPGQSFPLLALMIVVIVAMVGLSVDVGNAYGQQRRVQNVANASALSALNAVMANNNNQGVWDNVKRTLASNRVDITDGTYEIKADYILSNAPAQWLGLVDGATEQVNMPEQAPPRNIIRVQITVKEKVGTYFARVVGRDTLEVNANGNACIGGFGLGVYPIGIPLKPTKNYHKVYNSADNELATNTTVWNEVAAGNWTNMTNHSVYLPMENEGGGTPSGTHIAWLNWGFASNSNSNAALDQSLTYPGDLQAGFKEGPNADPALPSTTPNGKFELTDWVDGSTGVKNGVKDELDALFSKQRTLILPMYDVSGKVSGKSTFHIVKFGRFRLVGHEAQGNPKFLKLKYLGEATNPVTKCSSEPDPDDSYLAGKRFNIAGLTKYNRVWRVNGASTTTNDIIIVMDTSYSMRFDWNDRRPGDSGYQYDRLQDAKAAVMNFVRNYDLAADPDARISFITFGGRGSLNSATTIQNNWTSSGCTTAQITSGACTADMKWRDIQTKANNIRADGNTPGPFAFERVQQQLQTAQNTRNGKTVKKVVLFATDGVFNICGTYPGGSGCPTGNDVCPDSPTDANESCMNSPEVNSVEPRPVWQGQQRANEIKGSGASVYIVALTPECLPSVKYCFNPQGLPEMSSGAGYYYRANDAAGLAAAYTRINSQIADATCVPREQTELAAGATMRLLQPGNPTFRMSAPVDSEGRWEFANLEAGEYVVKADPYTKRSAEDGYTRTYSRIRNGLNLSEEGQVSVTINSQYPDGSTVPAEVNLSLPTNAEGVPLNGCTTP